MIDTKVLNVGTIIRNTRITRNYPRSATHGAEHFLVAKAKRQDTTRPIFMVVAAEKEGQAFQQISDAQSFQVDHITLIDSDVIPTV